VFPGIRLPLRQWLGTMAATRCTCFFTLDRRKSSMRSSPSSRRVRRWFRPMLVELESRVVPSFVAPLTFDVGSEPTSVAVGEFNGDGLLDLAVANYGSANVSVLVGNGDGSYQFPRNFAAGGGAASVVAADLNGDGFLDLAVANIRSNTVSLLLGNGDGSFQARRDFDAGPNPRSLVAADLNGDGAF